MTLDTRGMSNPTRCRIFNYIMENRGRHFGEIKRELGLTKRGLGYHLEKMLKEGIIISQSISKFKYFYPLGAEIEPKPLTPTQEKIAEILRENPMTAKELGKTMGKTTRAVTHHLKKLQEKGFVDRRKGGNGYEWYIK